MPNIFPPIDLQRPVVGDQVPDDSASPGILGSVNAPSSASLALNGADNNLQAAQSKLEGDRPKKYDYSAHGVLGNVGHVLGRVANVAGDILDPAATSLIPGSDLNNAYKLSGDQEDVDKATGAQQSAQRESDSVDNEAASRADAQGERATAEQHYEDADPQRQATLKNTQLEGEKAQLDLTNGKPLDQAGVDNLSDIYGGVMKASGIKAPFRVGMSPAEAQRSVQALEHFSDQAQKEREFRLAQAGLALQRQVANDNRKDAQQQHEGDTGRKLLDSAEKQFRTGTQSADEMQQMIDGARGGNKVFAAAVPLEGALAINTSQGVKRINRTEVDQIAGAGSLFDKIHGEIGKLTAGQPIPPNVLNDQEQLVKLLKKGAYDNYKGTFDSAQKRYNLTNETPLADPNSSAPHTGAGGNATFRFDSQGNPIK